MKYPARSRSACKQLIELAQELRGAWRHQPFRQEHRARLGHEQRGADTVSGHIADERVHAI